MDLNNALKAETAQTLESYRHELRSLAGRVEQAVQRFEWFEKDSKQSPVSSHDAHNMAANLHELSRLAGRFEELQRLVSFVAQQEVR